MDTLAQQKSAKAGTFPEGYVIDKRYRILGFLGAGGFASVYRAVHEGMQREVAIKVMEKCDDETFIERFKREAMLAGSIQNPCIVSIYDCGVIEETGQLYMAMELLRGHDLEEELKEKGPLSPHRMYTLIRPVLDALGEGHAQGIVHKDLKPSNLFLNDPGGDHEYVKVLDFGVARKTTDQKLTTTGQMTGTMLYLAPEYINNTESVSPAIDVYQMALIISELLTGNPCVDGETYAVLMKHCMGKIELADFLKEGPAAEVFARATCVNPEERYQNCSEFGEALDSIADYFDSDVPLCGGEAQTVSKTSQKMSAGFSAKITSTKLSSAPNSAQVESPTQKSGKKKPLIPIIAGIVVVIIAIVILAIVAGGKDETVATNEPSPVPVPEAEPKPTQPDDENANKAAPAGNDGEVVLNAFEQELYDADQVQETPQVALLRQAAQTGNDADWARLGIYYHDHLTESEEDMFDAFMHIQDIEKLKESDQKVIYFYIGQFLYERLRNPKTPAQQKSKYNALECFRKAVKLRNFATITYLYENDLHDVIDLDEEFDSILKDFDLKTLEGESLYQLATLTEKECLYEQDADSCDTTQTLFSLASDNEYPGADEKFLASTICENPTKALQEFSKAAGLTCESDTCIESSRVLAEWAILNYVQSLERRCWNHTKSVSSIEKFFEKTIPNKENGLKDYGTYLLNYLYYGQYCHWDKLLADELSAMVNTACHYDDDVSTFLEVVSRFANSIESGSQRQACDVFWDIAHETLQEPCRESIQKEDLYANLATCYLSALKRGQLYAPFQTIQAGTTTERLLESIYKAGYLVSREDGVLKEHISLFLKAATLHDGAAQSLLGGLYRGEVKDEITRDFEPHANRACYWDKLAAASDFCKSCTNSIKNIACSLCDASKQNVQSCR